MSMLLTQLLIFAAKLFIIFLFILLVFIAFFSLLSAAKGKKGKGKLQIKNLNEQYKETKDLLLAETLSKKQYKDHLKQEKKLVKTKEKTAEAQKNIYVLTFQGDMKASTVSSLSEEITAVLNVATPRDEVVLCLESPGGVVHGYGLAAAQLMRIRAKNIPLTIIIDKVAASGGYMMAAVANKIIAAPFAIIGSIGVVVQLPNFHRLLKDKHIDFELHTAGEFKRTITLFGENTPEGRDKLQHELEDIHHLFKDLITHWRPQVDIARVATGEHWLAKQALDLQLVDEIKTSDDYLLERSQTANVYQLNYAVKKSLLSKLSSSASLFRNDLSF